MKKKNKNYKCSKTEASWALKEGNEPDMVKKKLSTLSLIVRQDQFKLFLKNLRPRKDDKVVDVGVTSVETLRDLNFFEKRYPYPERLTAASIDEPFDFSTRYPKIKFVQIQAGQKLPFADKSFDIATSWATLEHVGSKREQKFFLSELFRVGKKIFITTPYRGCFYEPHSGLFFLHWLPRRWFQKICHLLRKDFWATENNLRCLWLKDIRELLPEIGKTEILVYKMFGFIPSHLIIIKS